MTIKVTQEKGKNKAVITYDGEYLTDTYNAQETFVAISTARRILEILKLQSVTEVQWITVERLD